MDINNRDNMNHIYFPFSGVPGSKLLLAIYLSVWTTLVITTRNLLDREGRESPSFAYVREAPRRLSKHVDASSYKFLARANARSRVPSVPPPIDFSFLSFLIFIFFSSLAILRSQALGSVVPLPSPWGANPLQSFVAMRAKTISSLPDHFFTRLGSQHVAGIVVSDLWRQSWIKYYFEKTHRHVFVPVLDVTCNTLPRPFPWPSRSFPLLPLRLGDHAWGCLAGEESCAKRNHRAR